MLGCPSIESASVEQGDFEQKSPKEAVTGQMRENMALFIQDPNTAARLVKLSPDGIIDLDTPRPVAD